MAHTYISTNENNNNIYNNYLKQKFLMYIGLSKNVEWIIQRIR